MGAYSGFGCLEPDVGHVKCRGCTSKTAFPTINARGRIQTCDILASKASALFKLSYTGRWAR